ncbi:unnamed protein product [Caenorhabditis nigoni]
MPIELQQEPMKPDDDFDVAEDKLDHFDHFPALMEEVLDQQRKEMLHPKKSMAFLPVSFDAWLDANVEGWRTENLDEVNERLANWGPIQLSTANNVIIYGVVRISAATAAHRSGKPGRKTSVAQHFLEKRGVTLRHPGDRLVYLVRNPGSLLPAETLTVE